MFIFLFNFILNFIPFYIVKKIFFYKKAHTQIQLKDARKLNIIMIDHNYGIALASNLYDKNRLKKLKKQLAIANKIQEKVTKEINSLTFVERQLLFGENKKDDKL